MLPEIDVETCNEITAKILEDLPAWRKGMIHYIKDENPELNTAIIEIANKTDLDPKAVAAGAYMAYQLIEAASKNSEEIVSFEE